MSKTNYLKRYLDEALNEKQKNKLLLKKKLLSKKAPHSKFKIIDASIGIKSIPFGKKNDNFDEDDAPVVAEIIDERPKEVRVKELYDSSRWKKVDGSVTDETEGNLNAIHKESDVKESDVKECDTSSKSKTKNAHDLDSDISLGRSEKLSVKNTSHRSRHDSDSNLSPKRTTSSKTDRKRHDSSSDISPPRNISKNKSIENSRGYSKGHRETGSSRRESRRESKERNKRELKHDSDGDISPPRNNSRYRKDSKVDQRRGNSSRTRNYSKDSRQISKHRDSNRNISLSRNHSRYIVTKQTERNRQRRFSNRSISPCRSASKREEIKKNGRRRNDVSPPRSNSLRTVKKKPAEKEQKHDSSQNISPRNSKHTITSEKKNRHDSDSSISPPRHKVSKEPIKGDRRSDSSHDISPPRSTSDNTITQSKGTQRHDSDVDISPSRDAWKRTITISKDIKRLDSDSDISPPSSSKCTITKQKNIRHDSDSDMSPPRSHSKNTATKETKKPRTRHSSESDLSPPRKHSKYSPGDGDRPQKTLSGLKSGLQSAKTLSMEISQLREREKKKINELSEELSGKNAETIIRSRKTGHKRDLSKERQIEAQKEKKTAEFQQKYAEWGKGLEQTEMKKSQLSDDLYEASKPLARYQDDEDLDAQLKAALHDEDPMLAYMKKKQGKDNPAINKPTYTGPPAPPNRFGLQPGYRWDGVDRSNGFEKKYFESINKSKASQEEAYLWSVQEM